MDMNSDARATMNRWRTKQKNAERRIIRFEERISLRLEAILERTVTHRKPLHGWQIRQVYYRDVDHYEDIDSDWRPIEIGDTWGGPDVSAFFRCQFTIPEEMAGQRVFLKIYVGGDSLLRLDGVAHHGLDPFRNTVLLTNHAEANQTHQLELESYIYWYPSESNYNTFSMSELVTTDDEVEAAYWDFVATFKVLFIDNLDDNLRAFLETHLHDALLAVPVHEPDFVSFKQALLEIQQDFREAVFNTDRFGARGLMHMVGHSHLDIMYQWPHREYIRKIGRTHATMLRLMEQYPQFRFSQSSAKIYADMKTYYPELYDQVRQRIVEGRWQPVGAFWLEPDCNLISGESFVRQILHGQRFWQAEFGFTSQVCWQPDVFGMSWALPQILKRSGIRVILSNKFFVWNDTNPWRQNTFWWEGPDGSRVMTIIPPGHFIGMVDPDHMDKYWRSYSDRETIGETIYTYGWGDGGGGVDHEMLECADRYANFPGLVRTRYANPEDTLLRIADRAQDVGVPTWDDELYLEAHRGTYTTKGRLKKLNRRFEVLLREVELLASLAWLKSGDYPADQLDAAWKILLGTQFHDALPGTHITEVYHYLLDEYESLRRAAEAIREAACAILFGDDDGNHLLIFNPLLNALGGIMTVPADRISDKLLADASGQPLLQQRVRNLDGTDAVLVALGVALPACGYCVFPLVDGNASNATTNLVNASEWTLENRYLLAEFAANGELIRLWDKEVEREVLLAGAHGNRFQLYEDRPGRFDAWDIVSTYVEQELPIVGTSTITIDERGPLRASLRLVRRCYDSTITQRISLQADSRALTFETEIDWYERQRLLKVGFPVAVNARHATYDIAYGNIERPTHRNTSFDAARFEVPAHWWMDVSESGYGVALLNDAKYGHEAHGQWMRLTLLKGSISPDPHADREVHHFTYVLYPHMNDWREGGVMVAAARLNTPLHNRRTQQPLPMRSFIACDAPNVTLETVKRSEDGACLIVRLVERHNRLTRTTLTFDRELGAAHTCDLMENFEADVPFDGKNVQLELKPREIVTLAVR